MVVVNPQHLSYNILKHRNMGV